MLFSCACPRGIVGGPAGWLLVHGLVWTVAVPRHARVLVGLTVRLLLCPSPPYPPASRSQATVAAVLGALVNALIGVALKWLINQPRPPPPPPSAPTTVATTFSAVGVPDDGGDATSVGGEGVGGARRRSTGGMPSSHALSLAFLATLSATSVPPPGGMALLAAAVWVAASRVRPGVHTAPQVAVGFGA